MATERIPEGATRFRAKAAIRTAEAKTCTTCGDLKPITEFHRRRMLGPDGRMHECAVCRCLRMRAYAKSPHGREKRRAMAAARRANDDGREAARNAVMNAVASGRLVRPSACEECGAAGRVEGHHPDYSKPLEVRWLCDTCHYAVHGRKKRLA